MDILRFIICWWWGKLLSVVYWLPHSSGSSVSAWVLTSSSPLEAMFRDVCFWMNTLTRQADWEGLNFTSQQVHIWAASFIHSDGIPQQACAETGTECSTSQWLFLRGEQKLDKPDLPPKDWLTPSEKAAATRLPEDIYSKLKLKGMSI